MLLSALCVACGGVILAGCIGGANISKNQSAGEPELSTVLSHRRMSQLSPEFWLAGEPDLSI